jgi:hypothetical protein
MECLVHGEASRNSLVFVGAGWLTLEADSLQAGEAEESLSANNHFSIF